MIRQNGSTDKSGKGKKYTPEVFLNNNHNLIMQK